MSNIKRVPVDHRPGGYDGSRDETTIRRPNLRPLAMLVTLFFCTCSVVSAIGGIMLNTLVFGGSSPDATPTLAALTPTLELSAVEYTFTPTMIETTGNPSPTPSASKTPTSESFRVVEHTSIPTRPVTVEPSATITDTPTPGFRIIEHTSVPTNVYQAPPQIQYVPVVTVETIYITQPAQVVVITATPTFTYTPVPTVDEFFEIDLPTIGAPTESP